MLQLTEHRVRACVCVSVGDASGHSGRASRVAGTLRCSEEEDGGRSTCAAQRSGRHGNLHLCWRNPNGTQTSKLVIQRNILLSSGHRSLALSRVPGVWGWCLFRRRVLSGWTFPHEAQVWIKPPPESHATVRVHPRVRFDQDPRQRDRACILSRPHLSGDVADCSFSSFVFFSLPDVRCTVRCPHCLREEIGYIETNLYTIMANVLYS